MLLHHDTKDAQSRLADYCRTGKIAAIKGLDTARATHYRRLVYNVVDDTLRAAFPLTFHLLEGEEWDQLIDGFFAQHPCQSPQVWYMPKELYDYVMLIDHPLCQKYPFLGELLWFEWLEIEMYMQEDKRPEAAVSKKGAFVSHKLVINPENYLGHFYYPVHLKNARTITEDDYSSYFLAIHRTPDEGKVEFTQLSPALVRMLELLNDKPYTISELLNLVATEFNIGLSKEMVASTVSFLQMAMDKQLILGFQQEK